MVLRFDAEEIGKFLAILLRIGLLFFAMPFFSGGQISRTIKVLFALVLSSLLYMVLSHVVPPLSFDAVNLVKTVVSETIFTAVMTLAILIIFAAFQLAGEVIGFQMGFGFAQVADPQTGAQVAIISRWFQLLATVIFFSVNGHHIVLMAIVESFKTVPVGGFALTSGTFAKTVYLSGQLFVIGLKMAAPMMAVFFLTQAGLGLVCRFAPEINILIVSFPLTIILGFLFIVLFTSAWETVMLNSLELLFQFLKRLTQV